MLKAVWVVSGQPGSEIEISLHDGSRLRLEKTSSGYDPRNRKMAVNAIQDSIEKGNVLTGLLYINEDSNDLKEILNLTDTPLNKLSEKELCPGSESLKKINESLR